MRFATKILNVTAGLVFVGFSGHASAQPSSAEINFQLKYDACITDLKAEYAKADHPASFFLHGRKLVVGEEDIVKLYSDHGTQIVDGNSCMKDTVTPTPNEGIARLINVLADEGVRADLNGCSKLTGEKIEKALARIHPFRLESIERSRKQTPATGAKSGSSN